MRVRMPYFILKPSKLSVENKLCSTRRTITMLGYPQFSGWIRRFLILFVVGGAVEKGN